MEKEGFIETRIENITGEHSKFTLRRRCTAGGLQLIKDEGFDRQRFTPAEMYFVSSRLLSEDCAQLDAHGSSPVWG
jgi:hypothetical protein